MRLRSVTAIVLWARPPLDIRIEPAASPGELGVETVSLTGALCPGASLTLDGDTEPKLVYRAELAPTTTAPVVPPAFEFRL